MKLLDSSFDKILDLGLLTKRSTLLHTVEAHLKDDTGNKHIVTLAYNYMTGELQYALTYDNYVTLEMLTDNVSEYITITQGEQHAFVKAVFYEAIQKIMS